MKIYSSPLSGLCILKRIQFSDQRGAFSRLFCTVELSEVLGSRHIVQINHSLTKVKGTIRGLHFQHPPYAETKLISCLQGEVFDVAVDIRRDSSTFLRWHAEILNPYNLKTMVIPEGFAHGFQSLSRDCEMLYLHTTAYQPEAEAGLYPHDPTLDIKWPFVFSVMSDRDANHPLIQPWFEGVNL